MSRATLSLILILAIILTASVINAQRRVTPVQASDDLKIITKEELEEIRLQEKARQFLTDSTLRDSLARDSAEKAKKRVIRPLFMDLSVGVNVWDPLMRAFGQSYGGGDVWAALNLKNRYIPVVELGFGMADNTPDDGNFTYKTNPAFYGKIGMNYNFMASKDPKYQFYLGVRAAWSAFTYDITNVSLDNGYWGNSPQMEILGQSSHAFWGEIAAGIQVGLFKNFSMGWSVRYKFLFDIKDNPNSRPWYIPGYGSRESPITASLSLIYTIPLSKDEPKNVLEDGIGNTDDNPDMPSSSSEHKTEDVMPTDSLPDGPNINLLETDSIR